jgi:Rrf2 family transcriptional regulator, cysteine metabolism repressor
MRISSKGRYGLAAMVSMAQDAKNEELITIIRIAEKLGISKIYLEQVFSLLKRAELVVSIKGAQGGYRLAASPGKISVGQIMRAIEGGLFEKTENSVSKEAASVDKAMAGLVWNELDSAIAKTLDGVMLGDLVIEANKYKKGNDFMFYI